MAKRHKLVNASTPAPKKRSSIDWSLCVLCQAKTGVPMQYPTRSTREPCGSGYKSLAHHLRKFEELGYNPVNVSTSLLDDGDGIEATLMKHNAGWHKNCRLKVTEEKLHRLQGLEEKWNRVATVMDSFT